MAKLPKIVTLTTDMGSKDPYLAMVKGRILQDVHDANIIDISNQITPFDLSEAALFLMQSYRHFPIGTIHLIGVESGTGNTEDPFILVDYGGHLFLGRDNGVLSLIESEPPTKVVKLTVESEKPAIFPLRDVLAPAVCRLLKGAEMDTLGETTQQVQIRTMLNPVIKESIIRGTVIYIDRYGNIITNIRREDLLRFRNYETCRIYYSRTEYFEFISNHYNDVPEGEKVCLLSTANLLEIAINKGNAGDLLGIEKGHLVLIEFL